MNLQLIILPANLVLLIVKHALDQLTMIVFHVKNQNMRRLETIVKENASMIKHILLINIACSVIPLAKHALVVVRIFVNLATLDIISSRKKIVSQITVLVIVVRDVQIIVKDVI